MDTQNNTPTANPLEVAVRDLCGKVDAYLKQGCLRSELYQANERVKDLLNTLPEQPVEGLEEEIASYWNRVTGFQPSLAVMELTKDDLAKVARHFAEWGASHAVAPHYFKLREIKTGRVFLGEWSDMAGEWYERGNGKAYQSEEVEIIQHDKKTPTP